MSDILALPKCLIGDCFSAHCKKRPHQQQNKGYKFRCCSIGLITKAYCRIRDSCDCDKEAQVIARFRRAFEVYLNRNAALAEPMGKLVVDYCKEYPKLKNKHTSLDYIPDFDINRIREHPLVCVEDSIAKSDAYAEVNPGYSPK